MENLKNGKKKATAFKEISYEVIKILSKNDLTIDEGCDLLRCIQRYLMEQKIELNME